MTLIDDGPSPEKWLLLRDRVLTKLMFMERRPAKYWFSRGGRKIDEVVLHDTGSGVAYEKAIKYMEAADDRGVSIHYYIGREAGQLTRMVPETRAAIHADDRREGISGHNARSIGIEMYKLESDKGDFTDWQYDAVSQLVYGICWRHQIPLVNVVPHSKINPKHRGDPRNFDWDRFETAISALQRAALFVDASFALPLPHVSMRLR